MEPKTFADLLLKALSRDKPKDLLEDLAGALSEDLVGALPEALAGFVNGSPSESSESRGLGMFSGNSSARVAKRLVLVVVGSLVGC